MSTFYQVTARYIDGRKTTRTYKTEQRALNTENMLAYNPRCESIKTSVCERDDTITRCTPFSWHTNTQQRLTER